MRARLGAATKPEDGDPVDWVARAHEPAGRHRAARLRPRLVTVPERLAEGRRSVSRSAVAGVVAIVLAVLLVGGVRVAWAVRDSQPEVISAAVASGDVGEPDPAGSALEQGDLSRGAAPGEETAPTVEAVLIVHIAGQVHRPGIVRLTPGDRVVDAIEAAGGATPEADVSAVNLARPVVDGEQVYLPLPGEIPPVHASGGGADAGTGGGGPGGTTVIDLNTADAGTLIALPGVGPVLAERIVAWRTEHGRFTSVDELGEVSGIGDTLLSQLRDKVRVGP